jgi:uncharacterized membrane protein YcaP (DUF421 family)
MLPDLLGLDAEDLAWYQMCVRTVIVFILAIIFIRVAGVRTFGTKTSFDIVVSITLGALLSRCITGHYPFFPTLSAVLCLALFHRFSAWIVYRSKFLCRLMEGDSIPLFRGGKREQKNLAKHCVSEKDITKALHEQNLAGLEKVESIWLEPDGKISVVKKQE